MDWRALPPLASLRAFAAFAQTGSVADAGDALGVSHAAISQQLRSLETHLDLALLDRTGRAMQLTAEGQELARSLTEGFGMMTDTVQRLTGASAARPLHISATPSFASAWLLPRLPGFRVLHGDVDILLNPTARVLDMAAERVDVAIRYGTGTWPGVQAEPLIISPMVVVGAPALVGQGAFPSPSALAELPWFEEQGNAEARRWIQKQGVETGLRKGITQLPGHLMLEGVRSGQGLAVTVELFVEADIAAGRLRAVVTEQAPSAGYHLVTQPGMQRPVLKDFLRWMRREAAKQPAV